MWTKKASKTGARVSAERSRQRALDAYYAAPNVCKNCDKVITVSPGEQVATARLKQFCNRSCSAFFANRTKPKLDTVSSPTRKCDSCSTTIVLTRGKGGYRVRKFCDVCKAGRRVTQSRISGKTKGELRQNYAERSNFHSAVRAHSRRVYENSGRPWACAKCGYSAFVQICHLKSVSEFSDDKTIKEINDISNLVALCPTHHWELDHGLLELLNQLSKPGLEPGT